LTDDRAFGEDEVAGPYNRPKLRKLTFSDDRQQFRLPLRLGPPFPLAAADALPGGCTHLSPFVFCNFRRGGGCRTGTGQRGTEFCNLCVNAPFLLLEAQNGGGD
jgi:hypothetical protein